jgi:hypothetical protein
LAIKRLVCAMGGCSPPSHTQNTLFNTGKQRRFDFVNALFLTYSFLAI